MESTKWIWYIKPSKKFFQLIFALFRERLMDPNADLTDSEIRLGKGEQVKVSKN